jgi:hypothetical protein
VTGLAGTRTSCLESVTRALSGRSVNRINHGATIMHSTIPAFPDPVREVRYRIADLLAQIEADNNGLDPRTAMLALLETAFGAALTFCRSPDRARQHVDIAVQRIHAGDLAQIAGEGQGDRVPAVASPVTPAGTAAASPQVARVFVATTVAILSWATVVFLAHRGSLSPWNLLGPLFCTLLAFVSAYRFVISSGHMRPWAFFSRHHRARAF